MLDRTRVAQLLGNLQGRRVIVLGDLMLDEFVWGKVRRISPEAPVPVLEVIEESWRLGGAANVAANIQALGATPIPIGIIGQDRAGESICDLMRSAGISADSLIQDERITTLKTRILAHSQQIARIDRENRAPLASSINKLLETAFFEAVKNADSVVVSDYDKSVVSRDLMQSVLPKARAQGIPVFLDPKVHHADLYHPVTMVTPNQSEAQLLSGISIRNRETLEAAGLKLLQRFACEYVLITRGEEGMSLFDGKGSHHLSTVAREVFDVTGAGDTVIATLAASHAGGASMEDSAILANHAAGIVVGRIGTATVSAADLLADFDSRNAHSSG